MEDNVDVWGMFGLEAPAEESVQEQPAGEQVQEIAEPADTGEQDQDPADPEHDDDEGSEEGEEPEAQPDKKPLTKEERAENARRRRQKEVDDAVKAALEKERAEQNARLEKFFRQAQMKNQHQNGALIDSLEKAEQWAEQDRLARLNKNLQKGSLTAEDLQTALETSPAMQELKKQAARPEPSFDMARFLQDSEIQMAQIQKMDPAVKTLADIIRKPQGRDFAQLVRAGKDYLTAYKMAFHDEIVEQERKIAATGARVASGGKDHLTKTAGRGAPAIEVPKDVKESYRMLNPGMTDADIEKAYQKFMGRK